MHQASVGFHCPECARAGRQKVVRGTGGPPHAATVVTNVLIALNVAIFVFGIGDGLVTRLAVSGDGGLFGPAVADGEWYRIVTSGFLHYNALHIGFNMFALYQLGQLMEPFLGRLRFVLVYFVAMLSGSLGVLLISPDKLTVGASGAVFGLMGAAVAAMRSRGIDPFQTSLGSAIVLNLLITFSYLQRDLGRGPRRRARRWLRRGVDLADLGPRMVRDSRLTIALVVGLGLAVAGTSIAIA